MDDAHGQSLLRFARARIAEALGGPRAPAPAGSWCAERRATFVTLWRDGALHGCIGSVEAERSVIEDVAKNAVAAGLADRERAAGVGAEVEVLERDGVRPVLFDEGTDALVDDRQTLLSRRAGAGLDDAAVDRVHAAAAVGDDAEAGVGGAGIDPQDDHAFVILRKGSDACP